MSLSILQIEDLRVEHDLTTAELLRRLNGLMTLNSWRKRLDTEKKGGKGKELEPEVIAAACAAFSINDNAAPISVQIEEAEVEPELEAELGAELDTKVEPELETEIVAEIDISTGDSDDADDDEDEELAELKEKNRKETFGNNSSFIGMTTAELIEAAEGLTPTQTAEAAQIMHAAALAGLSDLEFTPIKLTLAKATGAGKRALDAAWKDAVRRAGEIKAEPPEDPAETRRRTEEERQVERDELWPKVQVLAEDEAIVEQYVARVQADGVVGEAKAIRANLIIYTSRLLSGTALGGLVVGPPASGKSFVAGQVLKLIPPDEVEELTGASAKALYFLGGAENATALKHKVLFLAEAAALSKQGGEEHELARILRMLIDGHASYSFTDFENKTSVKAEIEGPVAVNITSARDNVEAELKTRLLQIHANESPQMTRDVVARICNNAAGVAPSTKPVYSAAQLVDYQRWLSLGAPYRYVIPFAPAFFKAWETLPAPLRARRDVGNTMRAIRRAADRGSQRRPPSARSRATRRPARRHQRDRRQEGGRGRE
jgi:ethanolamine ammonia-lyase small subunit